MPRVRAPEFPSEFVWLNCDRSGGDHQAAPPLSLKSLRGRIVILDFWTYCCINCLHILPDLHDLEEKYRDRLTIIGVHSAKFDHEADVEAVRQAILRYDIQHPVIVDRDFYIWQQYAVRAYPTLVVIDPAGYVVGMLSGEGQWAVLADLLDAIVHQHQADGSLKLQVLQHTLEKQRQPVLTPLAFPGKVFADPLSDRLFIADTGHHRLIISTLTGEDVQVVGTGQPGWRDGSFDDAQFTSPHGITRDRDRHCLYVADTGNHAIRRIDLQAKTVETIAGTGQQRPSVRPGGGPALTTALNSPWDLEWLGDRVWIAMAGPHQIWELHLPTEHVKTYAGTGAEGCVDGDITQAAFAQPSGITTDGTQLLIADSETSSIRAIELGARPQVGTICGSGNLYDFGDVDGVGDTVRLQHCLGVAFADSVLWVADTYNHKIKQVDVQTGACHSLLGTGQVGYKDGAASETQFSEPSGISATPTHLFIADTNNHVIRKVDRATFTVTTLELPELCAPDVCLPHF